MFEAEAGGEVTAGTETETGVDEEVVAFMVGSGFPVGNDAKLATDVFDAEVVLPESGPGFGGEFGGFGVEKM